MVNQSFWIGVFNMRFKEVYESENNFDDTYKPCDKCKSFDINCDDCVAANDMDLSDFDFDIDDIQDEEVKNTDIQVESVQD